MASTDNQNAAPKKLPVNIEISKTSEIIETTVQDPLVAQIGNYLLRK